MKQKIRFLTFTLTLILTVTICFSYNIHIAHADTNNSKIHFITLPGNSDAIVLESNGKFGMVDSGEDWDYPDGSESIYPFRPGIVTNAGYEDRVIEYLNSIGVNSNNFEFYIGTHPHSDHIGSADEIIKAFHPKRVYIQDYKDSYINNSGRLWDNLYVYDHMVEAAQETGSTLIQYFSDDAPLYPETISITGSIIWDDFSDAASNRPQSLTIQVTSPDLKESVIQEITPIDNEDTDTWSYTFESLPKYNDEKEPISYTISLNLPDNYTLTTENGFDFTCSNKEINPSANSNDTLTVIWDDNNNNLGYRPDSLQVQIQKYIDNDTWIDIDSPVLIIPDSAQNWTFSLEGMADILQNPQLYRFIPNAVEHYSLTFSSESSLIIIATCNETPTFEEGGINENDTSLFSYEPESDNMQTSAIPETDQVDSSSPLGPFGDDRFKSSTPARSGAFDNYTGNTSTPSFMLGDMLIEIKNYGTDYQTNPKADANYFSLGVKVSVNGVTAFLAGDINNYEGTETALAGDLGHIDLLKLGHHGGYGSNTWSYLQTLSPQIAILTGTYSNVSNSTFNNEIGTLDCLKRLTEIGTRLYATGWYSEQLSAIVISMDTNLSNNIPIDTFAVASAKQTSPYTRIYYKDGLISPFNGFVRFMDETFYFENSPFSSSDKWLRGDTGEYYYLTENGNIATRWAKYKKQYYYFDSNGIMQTGWIKDKELWYYLDSTGKMLTGKQKIGNAYYYFYSSGAMATDAYVSNEYYDKNGKLSKNYVNPNWRHNSKGWWYILDNGTYAQNQWLKINNIWYYFNSSGYRVTGWQKHSSSWYYFNQNGEMQTGWIKNNNYYYFLDSSGIMQTGWIKTGNKWYYLNSSGKMQTGWLRENNVWYYFNPSGAMITGWVNVKNKWYFMNSNGSMTTGWRDINGKRYYFNENGAMRTGWINLSGKWYYLNADGAMTTGWIKVKNIWYFIYSNGEMAIGWITNNGNTYYLNSNGSMTVNKWINQNGTWYYFAASGAMSTGWTKIKNIWYYLNSDGSMATGWLTLKNKTYYLNSNGAMQTRWVKLDGKWYYFNSSGVMLKNSWVQNKYYVDENGIMLVNTTTPDGHKVDKNGAKIDK